MGGDDWKTLLLDYFTKFDNFVGERYLNMFVLTSVGYLIRRDISPVPSVTVTAILEKMISAAEVISHHQKRRDVHRCSDAEDAEWIRQLHLRRATFSSKYDQLFRRLLHAFERSYTRGVLTGDQDDIRLTLHESLEAGHQGQTCEVAECPWISHQCPGAKHSDYGECPLLATGEEIALDPASPPPGAHADDETSAPKPSTQYPRPSYSSALAIAQSTVQPDPPLHPGSVSSTSAIHDVPENPTDSLHPTRIQISASFTHQTASPASSEAASQPHTTLAISPESHLVSIAVPVSSPVHLLSNREDEPSDSDGEAPSGRILPEGGPVASQQASSASAAEAPGRSNDVPDDTSAHCVAGGGSTRRDGSPQVLALSNHRPSASLHECSIHSAGPTSTGKTTPGHQAVASDARQESESSHGPPLAHLAEDKSAQQTGERPRPGPASALFQGDITVDGQGAQEFELATRDARDGPELRGERRGGLQPGE